MLTKHTRAILPLSFNSAGGSWGYNAPGAHMRAGAGGFPCRSAPAYQPPLYFCSPTSNHVHRCRVHRRPGCNQSQASC